MNTETNLKEAYVAPDITIVDVVYESIICDSPYDPNYDETHYGDLEQKKEG